MKHNTAAVALHSSLYAPEQHRKSPKD